MAIINYTIEALLGSAAELAALNPLLLDGQIGKEVDTGLFKIGNGVLNWNSIEYAVLNSNASVFFGISTDTDNLLTNSNTDGGLKLAKAALDTGSIVDGAIAGTYSLGDRITFSLSEQHKLGTLLLSSYVKRLGDALGGGFSNVFVAGGYTGETVSTALTNLQNAVSNLTEVSNGMINDAVTDPASTWSSSKVASEILSAVQALRTQLVGSAGAALDTIYELAEALGNNANFSATVLAELANCVKFSLQTLTLEQQAQARANISAADAALVGTYSQINDLSLLEHLGIEGGDDVDYAVTLTELADRTTALETKTYMFNCSMYKTDLDLRSGQYRTIQWRRPDGSLAARSTLSEERAAGEGLYNKRTETFFAADGTTVVRTTVYTLTYDNQGVVISEVIQSIV